MSDKTELTTLSRKIEILTCLWLEHRTSERMKEFFYLHDLGLPLAYMLNKPIFKITPPAQRLIEETFEELLKYLNLSDSGFVDFEEMLRDIKQ